MQECSASITTAGTDHLSHRLHRMGWTRREVVLLLYLVGCALGGVATFVSLASARAAYAVAAVVAAAAIVAVASLERLDARRGRGGPT